MKLHLMEIAGVGLLVAFASASALAQGAIERGVNQAGKAVGDAGRAAVDAVTPSPGPWTADNVSAARPFGTIDVSGAGSTTDQVRTWSQARTPQERSELNGRCSVINNPTYTARYPANAQEFCRTFTTAQASPPPATKN
jgi:hypothetical protein